MLRPSLLGLFALTLLGASLASACGNDSDSKSSRGSGGEGGLGSGGEPAPGGDGPATDAGAPGMGGTDGMGVAGASAGVMGDLCPAPTGEGTLHGPFVTDDETWTAADSPHQLPDGVSIDAVLTLEPCTVVQVGAGRDILVSGKLLGAGEVVSTHSGEIRAVTITRLDDEAWGSIKSDSGGGEIELHATAVNGGGAVPAGTQPHQVGAIVVEGERAVALAERLTLDTSFVIGSESQGVVLTNNVAFAAGSTLSVLESGGYPIIVGARAMGTVPEGTFANNGVDAIIVDTAERLGDAGPTDVVLRNLGVPYRIGSDVDASGLEVGVGNGDAATLTIEPGVELRFPDQFGLVVEGPDGTLIAKGTKLQPIVFTSDSDAPQAGDWLGLNFTGELTAETALDFVEVAYAGAIETGTSSFSCGTPPADAMQSTMGAIYLSLEVAPTQSFVSNSVLRDSASNGIDRGYTGDPIDFTATNTLENIAYCLQTEPKPTVGACPADPACPTE